jgi:hypothetical protein
VRLKASRRAITAKATPRPCCRNQPRPEGALLLSRFHAPGRNDPELQRREATIENLVEGHDGQIEVLPSSAVQEVPPLLCYPLLTDYV